MVFYLPCYIYIYFVLYLVIYRYIYIFIYIYLYIYIFYILYYYFTISAVTEFPMRGALVGELFANILADGFSRLQRGDRYWFENNQFTSSKIILLLHEWINSIERFFTRLLGGCLLSCLFVYKTVWGGNSKSRNV